MIRFPLSVLIASATALLLFSMDRQADAYDHFGYRPAIPSCHTGSYSHGFQYRLPDNRYDCSYDGNYSYRPSCTRCQGRDWSVPDYPMNAPAPRRGIGFQQPNSQPPYLQSPLRVNPPGREAFSEKQLDPFEKYAPSRLNSQKPDQEQSTPDYPSMELPPPVPESSDRPEKQNQKASPESQGREHDRSDNRGKPGAAGPFPKADRNPENRGPAFQPELPRISPPSAKFLIPQNS